MVRGPIFAAALLLATAVSAQQPTAQAPSPSVVPSSVPLPGELELSKMIWSTMAAVDHANRAGNYSVLRDLAAPGFQINNDAAKLALIFSNLRSSGIDLSNTLLLAPTFRGPPRMVQPDILQVQGFFGLRPTAIAFDLYYQWVQGRWRLFGVSINPAQIAAVQPGAAVAEKPQRAPKPK